MCVHWCVGGIECDSGVVLSMYKLTLTENQLRVIQRALEGWERMHMGQFWDFADEVAEVGTDLCTEHPDHKRIFDDYIDRRDRAREMFDAAFREAQPYSQPKTDDMLIAEDIWMSIRHKRWKDRPEPKTEFCNASAPVFALSVEPLPIVEKI